MPHLSSDTLSSAPDAGRPHPDKPAYPGSRTGPAFRPVRKPAETACYAIAADDDPGMLPRLMEPIAKRGAVPTRLHAVCEEGVLMVDIQVRGFDTDTARLAAETFKGVVGVHSVLFATRVTAEDRGGSDLTHNIVRKAG